MLRINNYKVAKYLRLSRDDGDDRESESIENQRDIVDSYIKEHEELEDCGEYVDDGYTGTNFNRPGFKKMLEDIENGKIDCIITKDLSRFGRDHIDTGYYLERYLPTNNIRYIAIGDNVDTAKPDGLQFLTFKLSFNDYYAQDISNKIKSVKNRKIEKGEFQGGIAPYGYKKDSEIKNHLIIDEYASEIVKEIFDMYVNKGMSTIKIAEKLNERKIEAPAVYLKIPVCMKRKSKNPEGYIWQSPQIAKMLKNEVYIGNIVGRKFQKISHKVERVRATQKDEYVIVKNMHEPIIDELTWRKAQDKLNKRGTTIIRTNNEPLKEFVYCAECGGKATYRIRKSVRKSGYIWEQRTFICSNKNIHKNNCTCKPIEENIIVNKVKEAIKEEIEQVGYTEDEIINIFKLAEEKVESKKNILKKQEMQLQEKVEQNEKAMEEVYTDKIKKIISADDFGIFYNKLQKEKKELLAKIHQIETELIELQKDNNEEKYLNSIKLAKKLLTLENPTKEIYSNLIKKIEFDSKKNVRVTLTFGKVQLQEQLKEVI